MWAIFKTLEYGFGDRVWCLGVSVFPVSRFSNNFSLAKKQTKISNYHLDLREVPQSFLAEITAYSAILPYWNLLSPILEL